MSGHESLGRQVQTILLVFIQLALLLITTTAHAITKASFEKFIGSEFNWENASNVIPGLKCDDCAQRISIGFPFPFAGVMYNDLYVSSNGLISLLAPVTNGTSNDFPTSGVTQESSAIIAPYWINLDPSLGGSITFANFGTEPNRRLVISWNEIPHICARTNRLCRIAGLYTFQAILHESGMIVFQYKRMPELINLPRGKVGIEVTNDDFVTDNTTEISYGTQLFFRPHPYVQSVTLNCENKTQLDVRYSYSVGQGNATDKRYYSLGVSDINIVSATAINQYTIRLQLDRSLGDGQTYNLQIENVYSNDYAYISPNPTTRPILGSRGLVGAYYSQNGIQRAYHSGPWIERNDAQVNFSWGTGTPDILPRGDDFSVRWQGYLIPPRSGNYVFRTYSDDGIRLWVNGTKIIDAWNDHAPRYDDSSLISLNEGVAVPIQLEHYERGGKAYAQLFWDEPDGTSGNFALIPSSALSPCPLTPRGPDHIRIEHDGQGLTCQPETITLKACADAACNTLYTDSVTVDLTSPGSGWSVDPITFSGGSITVDLSVASASTANLGATATSPTAANPTRCFVGSTESCELKFSACADQFNCLETGTLTNEEEDDLRQGRLYTKLAEVEFKFDVAALKSDGTKETDYVFSGGNPRTVKVELVDASRGGECSALPRLESSAVQDVTFSHTDKGRKSIAYVTIDRAWRYVKCRVTDISVTPNKVSCSTDGFAIRPKEFTSVTSSNATADTANGSSTTATPRFKAGSSAFDLTATAIVGYDGTPKIDNAQIDNAQIEAHVGATAIGSVTGSFGTATSSTGVASGSDFTYSEVGYFRFKPKAVYDDDFTSIDSTAGDCSNDFSNTPSAGKFGCKFGNSADTAWFGRFVPDRFVLTSSSLTPACASGFSYMDQPLALRYEIEARNAAGNTTKNYNGGFAKATVSPVAENNNNGVDLSSRLQRSTAEPTWSKGVLSFEDTELTKFKFMRANAPDGPFDDLSIGVSLKDNDGQLATLESMDMNATTSGNCATLNQCNAKTIGSPTKIRYGRMLAGRTHQFMETKPLTVPLMVEYFNGTSFVTNGLDSCTTLSSATALRLDNNQETNQTDGDIAIGSGSTSVSGFGTFSSGQLSLNFSAPGSGNIGFVDFTPDLESMTWLRYDWDSNGTQDNPQGRASWGLYRGNKNVIYLRERWN